MRAKLLSFLLGLVAIMGIVAGLNPKLVEATTQNLWQVYNSGGVIWAVTRSGHWVPGTNVTYDVGSLTKQARNFYVANMIVSGTYSYDDSVSSAGETTVGGNLTVNATSILNATNTTDLLTANNIVANSTVNTTGLLTTNGIVANTTINSTGLATLDNLTVNGTVGTATLTASSTANVTGTLTSNAFVGNSTGNFTGTLTSNALVGNSTINSTGLATLDNCTVNGTMTAVDAVLSGVANITGLLTGNTGVMNSTMNVIGLMTANHFTVNSTKTATLSGPVVLGMNTVTTDTNITATCSTICRITDIPNGTNIRITFTPVAAGTVAIIVDESGSIGNLTNGGNVTVNCTSGTINGLNNVTLTNATQVGGFYDPTTSTNVSTWRLHFPTTTSGFVYR